MGMIIRLKPVFKRMVWGGSRMREEFGYEIPGDDTGECWAISAHEHGDCIIDGGVFDGRTLSWLWEHHKELFTENTEGAADLNGSSRFPLLTKIIDARQDLSIQVHPDDAYAYEHENGAKGKTECWYVLDCDPDATIVIGHNAHSKDELKAMVGEGRWKDLIREIPIHKGDFFQIFPGTMHAIKGGTMILETQQNSDITYRVYDYGRLVNGAARELHLKQALDVIKVPFESDAAFDTGEALFTEGGALCTPLVSCNRYQVWRIENNGKARMEHNEPYLLCSVISGQGSIDGEAVGKGDHFILADGYRAFTLEGRIEMICSTGRKV